MPQMRAKLTLTVSIVGLVCSTAAYVRSSDEPPRYDLRGDAVIRTPTDPEPVQRDLGSGSNRSLPVGLGDRLVDRVAVVVPRPSTIAPLVQPVRVDRPGLPRTVSIPSLNLDAPVVPVGVLDGGGLEIPVTREAGWYQHGVRPGDVQGSAVLAGHVDHDREPGVFVELRQLDLGSEVTVTDDEARVHRYVVTERFQIPKEDLASLSLFRRTGDPVLTLITCGGSFDRKRRHYSDNVIIRATPLPTEPRPVEST